MMSLFAFLALLGLALGIVLTLIGEGK